MATTLFYNGIELRNVITKEFSQESVRDPSDTDIWAQKFTLTVETVVNVSVMLDNNPHLGLRGVGGNSPGSIINLTRKILSEDRKVLRYLMEGFEVLTAGPQSDTNNGPKVRHIRVTSFSAATLKISFTVEVWLRDCLSLGRETHPVIDNRWACVDDIDDSFRITRTWRGLLRIRHIVHNVHSFRILCIPVVQPGWKRIRMHFGGTPSGLELSYEITDRQYVGEAPPDPAIKMTIVHTESMGASGAHNSGDIVVRLEGSRSSSKRLLLQRCMDVLIAKLQLETFTNDSGTFRDLTLVDYSGDETNAVEARAHVIRTLPAAQVGENANLGDAIANVVIKSFGKPLEQLGMPNYDEDRPVSTGPYGLFPDATSLAGLFLCHLRTQCEFVHGMPQIGFPDSSEGEHTLTGTLKPTEVTYSTELIDYPSLNSPNQSLEHHLHMYTYARVESIIKSTKNRIQLPISRFNPGNASDTCVVIDLAPATAKRILRYSAERIGEWPKIWEPADFTDNNGIRHVLLDWYPTFHAPEALADGRKQYAIDAEYEFALNRAPGPGEKIATSVLPWDNFKSVDQSIGPTNMTRLDSDKGAK